MCEENPKCRMIKRIEKMTKSQVKRCLLIESYMSTELKVKVQAVILRGLNQVSSNTKI